VAAVALVLLSVSTFGWVTSCIGDAIHPDSDTSIGFGGDEDVWDLSILDRILGRGRFAAQGKGAAHNGHKATFSLSASTENKAWLLAKVAVLVAGGTAGAVWTEGFPQVDALYWTIMTLTTVGYGDVTVSSSGRCVQGVLIVCGLGLFSSFTDLVADWRLPLERRGAPPWLLLLLLLFMQAGAYAVVEDLAPHEGLYLAFCTVTTIGYGDLHPRSDAGKLAACLGAMLSVSLAGLVSSAIGDFIQDSLCAAGRVPSEKQATGKKLL